MIAHDYDFSFIALHDEHVLIPQQKLDIIIFTWHDHPITQRACGTPRGFVAGDQIWVLFGILILYIEMRRPLLPDGRRDRRLHRQSDVHVILIGRAAGLSGSSLVPAVAAVASRILPIVTLHALNQLSELK